MAHEISITTDGRAEAAFALSPAWHGLGTILADVPNSAGMLAASGLDRWTVQQEPVWTQYGKIPGVVANVRSDTREALGVVSADYSVVQNADAFAFMDSLTRDGIMKYEAAGALKGGRIVWVLARMPGHDEIAEGDKVGRYVLLRTSHDGSCRLMATPTSVRVVCANTLRIAAGSELKVTARHTGDMGRKLDAIRRYLSQFDAKFTLFRDHARKLATIRPDKAAAKAYMATLFTTPAADASKRAGTIYANKLDALRTAYASPRQAVGGIGGSWWALFNSVTEYVDHVANGYHGDARAKAESRMLSVMDGPQAEFKARAFRMALDGAGIAAAV